MIQIFSPKYESNFAKYWVEKKSRGLVIILMNYHN